MTYVYSRNTDALFMSERKLYQLDSHLLQGKRIVEMPEERPAWFSKNLMQRTTTRISDTQEVKPEQLG